MPYFEDWVAGLVEKRSCASDARNTTVMLVKAFKTRNAMMSEGFIVPLTRG